MSTAATQVLVVGLGHAGVEAALAAARMGCSVVGVTQDRSKAGLMSCNPAIGGPGKSQLAREIDALGGAMAAAADAAGIQYRLLNRSKGPAIHATRVQVDRARYARAIQEQLRDQPGLRIVQGTVEAVEDDGERVTGVRLEGGEWLPAGAVVITAGTFLRAVMHVGSEREAGGRSGDAPSLRLSASLQACGLRLARFKTGTPPRLDGRTIRFEACVEQPPSWTRAP
jgi:tRNA uridine 5-carboxymethylaminomethyl modification enzyme